MQYSKIINDQRVIFCGVLVLGDRQVINPTHDQLIAAGWKEYTPPPVEPQPQTEPDPGVVLDKMKAITAEQFVMAIPDNKALLYKELFPTWSSYIGKELKADARVYYDDKLIKVRQTHTVQAQYPPSVDTAALYVEIVDTTIDDTLGTRENPIAFNMNMELETGKYYKQDGAVYKCIRSLAACYWNLKDLVGNYVEKL
ncbi:hypothetical protein [Hoylesella buccalis]|uniref:hypothetical protein n=1 Tax=Hoylesella buccalis TaxID=28127 RepID=UPI00288B142F|nr:hypothetical protein [Hoylesella buccalis]